MALEYRKAGLEDLDALVASRVRTLRAANLLDEDADMGEVEKASRAYYKTALRDGTHIAVLVRDGAAAGEVVATGGVSFYAVMPTCGNPSGLKAYIMNMYTAPACRRRGIGKTVLDMLVAGAKARGAGQIALEATAAGRPLYAGYGFVKMENEMELPF